MSHVACGTGLTCIWFQIHHDDPHGQLQANACCVTGVNSGLLVGLHSVSFYAMVAAPVAAISLLRPTSRTASRARVLPSNADSRSQHQHVSQSIKCPMCPLQVGVMVLHHVHSLGC